MAKLVSFNSYDELLELMRSLGSTEKVTLCVLGARGSLIERPSGNVECFCYIAIEWVPADFPHTDSLYIEGKSVDSIDRARYELTSSNFSTYFPSGVCLLSDPLLKEVA